jgi:hypothetical protein
MDLLIDFDALYFNFFIIVVLGVHCDIYKSSYNLLYLTSPPPSFSFNHPPPIPGIVSTGLIFLFMDDLLI